jgi:hypothetical protein
MENGVLSVKPFMAGGAKKSLALVMPSRVVRECALTGTTIFALRFDCVLRRITLDALDLDRILASKEFESPVKESS